MAGVDLIYTIPQEDTKTHTHTTEYPPYMWRESFHTPAPPSVVKLEFITYPCEVHDWHDSSGGVRMRPRGRAQNADKFLHSSPPPPVISHLFHFIFWCGSIDFFFFSEPQSPARPSTEPPLLGAYSVRRLFSARFLMTRGNSLSRSPSQDCNNKPMMSARKEN